MKEATDAELVRSLRAGQQRAISILSDRYAGLVYSIAYRVLQNTQEAEDLTQDSLSPFGKMIALSQTEGPSVAF